MSEDYGACVVAIPQETGLRVEVDGGPHVTLLYFGDDALPNDVAKELIYILRDVAESYKGYLSADTKDLAYFGENEEYEVLELDAGEDSAAVSLRDYILDRLSDRLLHIFELAQTYPSYRPRMTLGSLEDGYELDLEMPIPNALIFSKIALWNGEHQVDFDLGDNELAHYGTPRHSGRYPWGSGDNPYQRSLSFLGAYDELRRQGLTEKQIAEGLGLESTTQLRARVRIEKDRKIAGEISQIRRMREERQMSNVAIAEALGIPESTVRNRLKDSAQDKIDVLTSTSHMLKEQVAQKGVIDVGTGVENYLGISESKKAVALAMLEEEGYQIITVPLPQVGMGPGHNTLTKVLCPPGTTYKDVVSDLSQIKSINDYSEDGGRTWRLIEDPVHISSKRIEVRYAEDGGADMDGVIQLRRGVDDISLGEARYAQVRIGVDGTHYLKGMAMYTDDLPDGVDIRFNTNKNKKGDIHDAMKPIKDDPDLPFGSIIRQKHYIDKDGKERLSVLNIVGTEDPDGVRRSGEEGSWAKWSKKLSSQMLSKQSHKLAEEQLGLSYSLKKEELDEIMSLTNPIVKKKLLMSFADGADADAVSLKAAGLPRTANHVILPFNTIKDNEIYAPNYRDGEKVVLIRHPHGGIFEIPELTVNNRNAEARRIIPNAVDAVGINKKVAQQLSGADFDGDTVLVIPNNSRKVKNRAPLNELKDFDPQRAYPAYDGMRTIDGGHWNAKTGKVDYPAGKKPSDQAKQAEMGKVSNLITDMTIQGATNSEIAKAVKHSMVVIDSEKHSLNYKQSEIDNDIKALKAKYQGGANSGASTIISRAKSQARPGERSLRKASQGGPIDPKTGKLVYTYTNATYVDKRGKTVKKIVNSTKMAETDDAFSLVSKNGGKPIETVYANHANRMKSLANEARKSALKITPTPISKTAKKAYAPQVDTLTAKLNTAQKNKPLERQAQVFANTLVKQKRLSNPDMDSEGLKKVKTQALAEARIRTGAKKQQINITPIEWEAIQAGAISNNKLSAILENTDLDLIKEYATPRQPTVMSSTKMARAKSMQASGYTQAEIADALGVNTNTLQSALERA